MTIERLSVGSSFKSGWFLTPLILGSLSAAGGLIFGRAESLVAFLGLGLFLLFLALVAWTLICFRRRFLTMQADGFLVEGPGLRQTWRDVEVESLAWSMKRNYSNGLPKSDTCRLQVWDSKSRTATMSHDKNLEGESAFVAFAGRVFEGVCARLRDRMEKGGELRGEGWSLGRAKFTWKGGEIAVSEVSAVGDVDDQIRVWKKGSNDAVFGLKAGERNATLLRKLLEELRPKEDGAKGVESGDDLGRVLFERRGSGSPLMFYLLSGVLVLIGCLTLTASVGWGLAVLGSAAACGYWGWWLGGLMFRCHESGVSRRTRRGTKTIRYRDVASYTYRATRHFVNGGYTGTTMSMEFLSRSELGRESIDWSASLQGMDEALEGLRDHISKVIAIRWLEELKAGKPVDWTPNLRLLPDGVEYRPSGFLGKKDWVKVEYGALGIPNMEKGVLYLFVKETKGSVIGEPVSSPNFFPGYYVLMLVLSPKGD